MARYVTEQEVAAALSPADAVAAVEACCQRMARGEVELLPRARVGGLAVMAAADRELGLRGSKTYAAGAFVVSLFDGDGLVAVIEADRLGQLRTGAASAVAARQLARAGARSLGIIGCGWQAEGHVAAMRTALPALEEVVAYCRSEERLDEFCAKMDAEAGESHRDAAEQDIVVTATTSRDPVLRGEWLRPGTLVCAIGANDGRSRELDNTVVERAAFVCCDSLAQARRESADLIEPVEQGVLDWLEVHELHEVVAGDLQGRGSDDDVVLFKSNGIAAWDVAAAAAVLAKR
ncbi:MAG: ornithine cyclodeaminase family protein [Actinomycetota bacterium]|nr:ornithine cyclodeaminase family protein [Actinomycetota bacterium]